MATMTSCAQQNLAPQLPSSQWQPGRVYFSPGNVTYSQAYAQSGGYISMITDRTVPTLDEGWAWTYCQYVQVAGGQPQTAMCIYRKSKHTTIRDIPFGVGNQGYSASFSQYPVGCTAYARDAYGYYTANGQKIYIRLD